MTCDNAFTGGRRHELVSDDHGGDTRDIADIDQRISIQHDEVGSLAHLDGTLPGVTPEKAGGVDGSGLKRFEGRETGLRQPFEFIVKAEARHQSIAPREKAVATGMQIVNRLQAESSS